MNLQPPRIRALGLCSGGLDSILAGLTLRAQDLDVTWISFETPFFSADKARKASRMTGIPLRVESITPIYLEMLQNPPCGYGKHMNPCMDCHALMFRLAGEIMTAEGYHFLFSGEVRGQRPMSQTTTSLRYVEKNSGHDGYILRPLSARIMPETIPEQRGWVDRARLLDFSGRSRKPQIALAKHYGVAEYPAPAGGCLLTEKVFSSRLKDLFAHQTEYAERDFHLLKFGRHFRLNPATKAIIGRTKQDNELIMQYYLQESDILVKAHQYPGPTVLLPYGATKELITLAGAICVGYSKAPEFSPVEVRVITPQGQERLTVIGLPPTDFKSRMI